jgi:hypothetical protein
MSVDELPEWLRGRVTLDPSGCWLWSGSLRGGYGRARIDGVSVQAHRFVYRLTVDPNFVTRPGGAHTGLQLDHLCRNKSCVNPAHLEPVTHAENMRRVRLDRPHGHPTVYARGCRCDECRRGEGDRIRQWRRTHEWQMESEDPRHGTANGYFNLHCRCVGCREAGSVANRSQHARRKGVAA